MLGVVLQLFSRQQVGWIGGFAGYLYYFESQCLDGFRFGELSEGSRVDFAAVGSTNSKDPEAFRMAVRVRLASGPNRRCPKGDGAVPRSGFPFSSARAGAPEPRHGMVEHGQRSAPRLFRNPPYLPP
jgi:hypothetical protein